MIGLKKAIWGNSEKSNDIYGLINFLPIFTLLAIIVIVHR